MASILPELAKALETRGIIKEAGFWDKVRGFGSETAKNIPAPALLAGAAITGALGGFAGDAIGAIRGATDRAHERVTRGSDFRNMMRNWGNQAGLDQLDPTEVRGVYDTLHRLATPLAREPYIVGPLVFDAVKHSRTDAGGGAVRLPAAEVKRLQDLLPRAPEPEAAKQLAHAFLSAKSTDIRDQLTQSQLERAPMERGKLEQELGSSGQRNELSNLQIQKLRSELAGIPGENLDRAAKTVGQLVGKFHFSPDKEQRDEESALMLLELQNRYGLETASQLMGLAEVLNPHHPKPEPVGPEAQEALGKTSPEEANKVPRKR